MHNYSGCDQNIDVPETQIGSNARVNSAIVLATPSSALPAYLYGP